MKTACLILTLTVLTGAASIPAPLLDRWSDAAMTEALTTLGASGVHQAKLAGHPGLIAVTPDGLNLGLYAKACAFSSTLGDNACRGVEGWISYDPGNGVDRALLVDKLNHDFAAGKFTAERDGSVRLTRYLDLEGGVSQANLTAELAEFFSVATAAKQTIWAAPAR